MGDPIVRLQYPGPWTVRNRSSPDHCDHLQWRIDRFALCRISDLGDVPILNVIVAGLLVADAGAF